MNILFQDKYFIAISKPPGLLVHRSDIDRHETRFALQMVRDYIKQRVYPVHRLDKPTSGVLLFALDQDTARKMMPLFVENQVAKSYLSVVRGYTSETDVINYPLVEQWDKMVNIKATEDKPAQHAITEYHRLATAELDYPVGRYKTARYSLLDVRPRTGRKHQIRRHLKHVYHPIVGDTTHGDGRHNKFFRDNLNTHRLLLHAQSLSFIHPQTGKKLLIKAGLEEGFRLLAERMGWGRVLQQYNVLKP